jgi:uncharacterized protein YeeX (DUF496 family)
MLLRNLRRYAGRVIVHVNIICGIKKFSQKYQIRLLEFITKNTDLKKKTIIFVSSEKNEVTQYLGENKRPIHNFILYFK